MYEVHYKRHFQGFTLSYLFNLVIKAQCLSLTVPFKSILPLWEVGYMEVVIELVKSMVSQMYWVSQKVWCTQQINNITIQYFETYDVYLVVCFRLSWQFKYTGIPENFRFRHDFQIFLTKFDQIPIFGHNFHDFKIDFTKVVWISTL